MSSPFSKQPGSDLVEKLSARLSDIGMELVDAVQLPRAVDRGVRLRTLEEALEEFEQEAREIFLKTELALEGVCYEV